MLQSTRQAHPLCCNNTTHMQYDKINIKKNTNINTNESRHSEMGPVRQKPIQRTVRTAHLSVLMTVHRLLSTVSRPTKHIYKSYQGQVFTSQMTQPTVYDCAQLQHTIQHRTVLIISHLTSRQSSQLRCCLSEERGNTRHANTKMKMLVQFDVQTV